MYRIVDLECVKIIEKEIDEKRQSRIVRMLEGSRGSDVFAGVMAAV